MPMNRIQFQRGMSLAAFQRCYGTEAQCEAALFEARWPRGFVCPQCASPWHSNFERAGQRLWQCARCRAQSSLTAGTVFAATKLSLLPDWRTETVTGWARRALAPSTHVVSDGLSSFVGVQQAGCTHEPIPHGTGKQSAQHPRFIWVNTLLGNLKRSLAGTYHAFKARKYGQRYLAEFQYRFNHRFDLPAMIPSLTRAACRADVWAERHLRLAEIHR
jgi:ribosomal protein L37AE/L43A